MPMKNKNISRGSNILTITIENIMKDYGGSKYKNTTLTNFKNDLAIRFQAAELAEKNKQVKEHIAEVASKIQNSKNVEKSLLYLNEILFSYFEDNL